MAIQPPQKAETALTPAAMESTDKVLNEAKDIRVFKDKWRDGRPWLLNTTEGMKCTWCIDHKTTLKNRGVLKTINFIDGCKANKRESICYHEKSSAHLLANVRQLRMS